MNTTTARAFLPTLRSLDQELQVPIRERLRILRELESDLEELYGLLVAQGVAPDDARRRAVEALVPAGQSLAELSWLHAPLYWRMTRNITDSRLKVYERTVLVLATLSVVLVETLMLLRLDLLSDASPFMWPVLVLSGILTATLTMKTFTLWIKGDHQEPDRGLGATLVMSGIVVATGFIGAFVDFVRLASVLESSADQTTGLFMAWLIRACALLSVSMVVALAGGVGWFFLSQWRSHQIGARDQLLGTPSARSPTTRTPLP
jgi:hypothetical protein